MDNLEDLWGGLGKLKKGLGFKGEEGFEERGEGVGRLLEVSRWKILVSLADFTGTFWTNILTWGWGIPRYFTV